MLFQRRIKQPLSNKIRNLLWPSMGFRRVLHYYKHRSIRLPASEHSIAAGLAFGCAVSWTPTFGTHLLQCALFSWLFKTNWIASFLGSALGNPWTTPFMMVISYYVGKALLVATGHGHFIHMNEDVQDNFDMLMSSIIHGTITYEMFIKSLKEYVLPTLLGGYTLAFATFPLFYYPFYFMVKGARVAHRTRLEKKVHREIIEVTGQVD